MEVAGREPGRLLRRPPFPLPLPGNPQPIGADLDVVALLAELAGAFTGSHPDAAGEPGLVLDHPASEGHPVAPLDPGTGLAGTSQLDPDPVPRARPHPKSLVGGDLLHSHALARTGSPA